MSDIERHVLPTSGESHRREKVRRLERQVEAMQTHRQRLEQIVGLLALTITDFCGGDEHEIVALAEARVDDPQPFDVDRLLRRVTRVLAGEAEPHIDQKRFLELLRPLSCELEPA